MPASIVVEQLLSADIETVWSDIANLASHVEWMADAERIDFVTDQRSGVGTTMKVLTKVGPLKTTDVMTFTTWDPPHRMGIEHRGLVTGTGEFILEPRGDFTLFRWKEDLTFPLYFGGRFGASIGRHVLAAVWRRNLKRLAARFD